MSASRKKFMLPSLVNQAEFIQLLKQGRLEILSSSQSVDASVLSRSSYKPSDPSGTPHGFEEDEVSSEGLTEEFIDEKEYGKFDELDYQDAYSEPKLTDYSEEDMEYKIRMFYRRPIYLPRSSEHFRKYQKQMSYFSERMAIDQYNAQKLEDTLYLRKHGSYGECYGQLLDQIKLPDSMNSVNGLAFNKSGDILAIGFGCGVFKICNIYERCFYSSIPEGRRSRIYCVRNHPDNSNNIFVGTTRRGIIQVCKQENTMWRTWEYGEEVNNEINTFDFNSYGTKMVTGGKDATLREYDFQTGKIIKEYKRYDLDCDKFIQSEFIGMDDEQDGHYKRVHAIKFVEGDENVFLSGGIDNTVKIWDTRTPTHPVRNINGPHICGDAIDCIDNKVLTGQWTFARSTEIWDLRTSRLLQTMTPINRGQTLMNEFIYCCKFIRHWDRIDKTDAIGDLIIVGGSGLDALEVQSIGYNKVEHRFLEKGHIVTIAQYEDLIAYGTNTNVLGLCLFLPSKFEDNVRLDGHFKLFQKIVADKRGLLDVDPDVKGESDLLKEESSNVCLWKNMFTDLQKFLSTYEEDSESFTETSNSNLGRKSVSVEKFGKCSSTFGNSDDSDFGVHTFNSLSDYSIFNVPSNLEFRECKKE